jgi:hypothetical protein
MPALEAQAALSSADVAWRRGQRQEAAASLRKVLALKPGADLERNAEVKLAAVQDPKSGEAIWRYLQPASGAEELRLFRLQLALEADPDNPQLRYLLGRRLAQQGLPSLASQHLGQALASGSLADPLVREAWRLKLQAEFEAGDCKGVRQDVGRLPDLGAAFKAAADDWRARCDFEEQTFHGPLAPEASLP